MSRGRRLWENDVLWNAMGSLFYALASMLLAFAVLRLAGPRDGGIFGFGFSTLGQQLFIVSYFGIRPFHITDMRGEYSFGEYLRLRCWTCGGAVLLTLLYLWAMTESGGYSLRRSLILLCLVLCKVADGYADVYESELQRQGRLYCAGQSLFFRTWLLLCTLLVSLALFGELLLSVALSVLMQLFGLLLFSVRPLRACPLDTRGSGEAGIQGVRDGVRRGYPVRLLRSTGLLFLSVFLDFYVFSASKYAVDQRMGAEASGIFNILFMPASLIYLLANFLIRPMLTRLAEEFREERRRAFLRTCRLLFGGVALLAVLVSLAALLLGGWGLGIFELLLGSRYRGVMRRELPSFLLLIAGGGLYALCNVQYYILVTMRRQREIFLSYLLAALAAFLTAGRMVGRGGIRAGAGSYVLLMGLLLIIFTLWVLYALYGFYHGKTESKDGRRHHSDLSPGGEI